MLPVRRICVWALGLSAGFSALALAAEPKGSPAGPVVNGAVLDVQGEPVAGVIVQVRSSSMAPASGGIRFYMQEARTDKTGRFSLRADGGVRPSLAKVVLPEGCELFIAGIEGVRFMPDDPQCGGPSVKIRADGYTDVTIWLAPPKAKVVGTVRDETGKAVPGSRVVLKPEIKANAGSEEHAALALRGSGAAGEFAAGISGPDGRFEIPVPPWLYQIASVTAPAKSLLYWPGDQVAVGKAAEGQPLELAVKLKLGGAVEVRVTDKQGKPVAGAKATLRAPDIDSPISETGASGADGLLVSPTFKPQKTTELKIIPPLGGGLAPVKVSATVAAGETAKLEATLPPEGIVRGCVTDEAGRPLQGVRVGDVETDTQGHYEMRGLAPGLFDFQIDPGPMRRVLRQPRPLRADVVSRREVVRDVVLPSVKTVTLTGRVTDHNGKPVPGAEVRVNMYLPDPRPKDSQPGGAITDGEGKYRLAGLLPERVFPYVIASAKSPFALPSGTDSTADLKEDQEARKDLQVVPVTVVDLLLRDEAGQPSRGTCLRIQQTPVRKDDKRTAFSGYGSGTSPSDADGRIRLALRADTGRYEPGDRRVLELKPLLGQPMPEPSEIELELRDGQVLEKVITLRAGAKIVGTLMTEDAKPLGGVTLAAFQKGYDPRRTPFFVPEFAPRCVTGEDGRFEMLNVLAGDYLLAAPLEECGLLGPERVEVSRAGVIEKRLVMKPGGAVTGWVYSPDGRKIKAFVRLKLLGAAETPYKVGGECRPDTNSPYQLLKVPPGQYLLLVSPEKVNDVDLSKHVPEVMVDIKPGRVVRQDVRLLKDPVQKTPDKPVDVPAEVF